jgi:hypothetical protein
LPKKYTNNINIQISQDPASTVTAQAAAAGPPAFVTPVYAYVFSDLPQDPSVANPIVTFNRRTVLAGGVTFNGRDSLTVPTTGDYAVQWETMFFASTGIHQHAAFGIFVNNTLQAATRSGLALFSSPVQQTAACTNGDAILSLNAGDVLTLRALIPAKSEQKDIPLTNVIRYPGSVQHINSASLRIEKLSAF